MRLGELDAPSPTYSAFFHISFLAPRFGEETDGRAKASLVTLTRGSGRALEGNQKRGALSRNLATNRPSEIVQISRERIDLRCKSVFCFAAPLSASGFWPVASGGDRRRDVGPCAV